MLLVGYITFPPPAENALLDGQKLDCGVRKHTGSSRLPERSTPL